MAALPVNTIRALLGAAGINDIVQFNDQTNAKWMARDMFDNEFASFIAKKHNEIDSNIKTYANLPITQDQIRIQPGVKRGLKAVLQWVKDLIQKNLDPTIVPFPVLTSHYLCNAIKHIRILQRNRHQ